MKSLFFLLLSAAALPCAAQTSDDRVGPAPDAIRCPINRHGNAPASAQKLVTRYEREHKDAATARWTDIDPRLLQAAARRAFSVQAFVGRTDDGAPCLLFFPAGAGFAPVPDEEVEEVYIVGTRPTGVPGAPEQRFRPFVDAATARRYAAAFMPAAADPVQGFRVQPGIVNAMAALPEIQSMRIYLCDDPDNDDADRNGILFVGVMQDGTELWGARSFYQDGSTLMPQQCNE